MKKINKEGLRSEKGFTMIELIIVIAILGILAAILVPSFAQMTRKSRLNADINSVRNAQTQMELYVAEHDGEYPGDNADEPNGTADGVIETLVDEKYLKETDANDDGDEIDYQTGDVTTAYDEDVETLVLDISGADQKVQDLYDDLSDRDQLWVIEP